jgi:hypothetical protein
LNIAIVVFCMLLDVPCKHIGSLPSLAYLEAISLGNQPSPLREKDQEVKAQKVKVGFPPSQITAKKDSRMKVFH